MSEIQTLLGYLTPISITVGVIYHIMTLNNTRKMQQHALETRVAQLFMQLYSFYDNKEFLRDYGNITNVYVYEDAEDWWRKYSPQADGDAFASWLRVGRFFDGVGILVERNLIEKELVFELLGDVIRGSWEGAESGTGMGRWLEGGRELWDRPQLWRNYEYLYGELMKYIEEHPELR
jgi:hypothetical protein